jgi:hypothetical protein
MKIDLYCANMCKHEHKKNMTRLWYKIVFKTNVEQTEGKERSYFYLYPFTDLPQGNFQRVSMCTLNKKAF